MFCPPFSICGAYSSRSSGPTSQHPLLYSMGGAASTPRPTLPGTAIPVSPPPNTPASPHTQPTPRRSTSNSPPSSPPLYSSFPRIEERTIEINTEELAVINTQINKMWKAMELMNKRMGKIEKMVKNVEKMAREQSNYRYLPVSLVGSSRRMGDP